MCDAENLNRLYNLMQYKYHTYIPTIVMMDEMTAVIKFMKIPYVPIKFNARKKIDKQKVPTTFSCSIIIPSTALTFSINTKLRIDYVIKSELSTIDPTGPRRANPWPYTEMKTDDISTCIEVINVNALVIQYNQTQTMLHSAVNPDKILNKTSKFNASIA